MRGIHHCPACKITPVVRRKPKGAIPRCPQCLDTSRLGRLARQRAKRRNGYDAHRDARGRRYGEMLPNCIYCGKEFVNTRRGTKDKCCQECMPRHTQVLYTRRLLQKTSEGYKEKALFRQRVRKLERLGIDPAAWFATDKSCGICGTTEPTGKGFVVDHDHKCCSRGCPKCFRGVLCGKCNSGLGFFSDSQELLRRAAKWVRKHSR